MWHSILKGNAPVKGQVVARRTTVQEPHMLKAGNVELDIPQRPSSNFTMR
jgi:hypothetical protein